MGIKLVLCIILVAFLFGFTFGYFLCNFLHKKILKKRIDKYENNLKQKALSQNVENVLLKPTKYTDIELIPHIYQDLRDKIEYIDN